MNGQPNLGHFGPPSSSTSSSSSSSASASSSQITTNNRPNIRQNNQQQGSSASSIASVAAQLHHNHHQQQQHDQYLLQAQQQQQQQNYLETFSPPLPPQSPHSNNNIYRSQNSNSNAENNLIYAQKGDNDNMNKTSHQQLQMVQQEIFLQMRQQYETQIRTLQMEICSIKSQSQSGGKGGGGAGKTNRNNSSHIVDTYCEQLQTKDFECKNCAYKTKSEASLVIHNTNHLVNQRYLHLPTTVFSVNQQQRHEQNANPFLYPCGECSGKYSHNDLYLHIYEHHTGEHPFHCDECDLYFMHFEFLDDHQRSTHMKHPSKAKKSRYDSHHHTNNSSTNQSQLTYYSVVKCSKPFSVLAASGVSSGGSAASRSWNNNSNHDSQNSHNNNSRNAAATTINNNQNMMMMHSGFKPNSPMPPNFPTYGSGTWKRGRGRGGSSMASCHNNNSGLTFGSSGPSPLQPSSSAMSSPSSSPSTNSAAILSQPPPPPPPSMHQIPEVFKCHFEDCFFVADAKDRLDFHLYAHQNSRFKCPHCPYVSNVLNDIKRHCVKGAKHEGAMFTCPSCEFPTNCDKTFRDHIRSIHFGKTIDDKTLTNYIEAMFQNVPPPAAPPPPGPSLGLPAPTSAHQQQQQLKSEL